MLFEAGIFVISLPPNEIEPAVGCMSPAIVRIIVDFPAPLAPRIATTSPSFTCSEMPWMTGTWS